MVPPKPELAAWSVCSSVNYCFDYGTSETAMDLDELAGLVNCCLDYGTSETFPFEERLASLVSYCLIYGISETRAN